MLPGLRSEGLGGLQAPPEAVVWQTPCPQPRTGAVLSFVSPFGQHFVPAGRNEGLAPPQSKERFPAESKSDRSLSVQTCLFQMKAEWVGE